MFGLPQENVRVITKFPNNPAKWVSSQTMSAGITRRKFIKTAAV
jgi:hypothetical protein